ncbi:hypothetical protein Tco_0836971 [Tanacetum coccineum]
MNVDAPPDIIDVDEDDDFIDDEDVVPRDLADSDDEFLANDDDDDDVVYSNVARGDGGDGGGDDRPPPRHLHRLPRGGRKPNKGGREAGTLLPLGDHATQWSNLINEIVREFPIYYPSWHKIKPEKKAGVLGTLKQQFDLTPHIQSNLWPTIQKGIEQHLAKVYVDKKSSLKKEHWVLKPYGTRDEAGIRSHHPSNIKQPDWERCLSPSKCSKPGNEQSLLTTRIPMESSETREYPSLIQTYFDTHTIDSVFVQDEARVQCEMLMLRDLGTNMLTGVPYAEDQIMAMVRKGKQRGHILGVGRVLAGQGRGTISINEPRCTHTHADVDELKDENKKQRKELHSQHEVGGDSGCGGGVDDELGADEDAGWDEDADGDDESIGTSINDIASFARKPVK